MRQKALLQRLQKKLAGEDSPGPTRVGYDDITGLCWVVAIDPAGQVSIEKTIPMSPAEYDQRIEALQVLLDSRGIKLAVHGSIDA